MALPAARCIADLLAPAARLVVEVDGAQHRLTRKADRRRDERLRRAGYRVLRIEAELVRRDLPAAVALVRQVLTGSDSRELCCSYRRSPRVGLG